MVELEAPRRAGSRSRIPRIPLLLLPILLLAILPAGAGSADETGQTAPIKLPPHPRVALVLSGGGARGAAHVGVLKVLKEMRVPVDLVVGTSMGSIVGGFYAAGWEPDEIEDLMSGLNWKELFVDSVARKDKTYRRKQDDAVFLVAAKLRFKKWKPYLPSGVLGGQRLELLLRSLEIQTTAESDFDRFPIPFRAVAADLANGDAVVLDHGSLATALRASMSIAGIFPPVEIDGRKLVDGGAAANLPIRIARQLGAERIIAVDITSPLTEEAKLGSLFSIVGQMSGLLTTGNRQEDLKALRPGDLLIQPELGDMTFTDFDRSPEAIAIGEKAARDKIEALRPFAVEEAEYDRFLDGHHRRSGEELRVEQVRLENSSWVDDRIIRKRLSIGTGEPFDEKEVETTIMGLSGLEYFGVIRDEFRNQDGQGILTVTTPAKPYGKNSLQFGFSFQDDFQGESSYSLSARHLLLAANRRGGEWENVGQIGDRTLLRTSFYQPLDWGMKWFVDPGAEILRENQTLWLESEPVADFRIKTNLGRLDVGRVLGEWGEARVGAYVARNEGEVRVGTPILPEYHEQAAGLQFTFRVDTRDASVFPRHGAHVKAWYADSSKSLGADVDRVQAYVNAYAALSFGRNTLLPGVEALKTLDGTTTLVTAYDLGGLFRLSGLGPKQLVGDNGGLAWLNYYRELSRIDLGALSSRVYLGASVETGNVYDTGDPVTWDSLRHAGSVYLGAQTPIGPAFLGAGFSDGGERRIYFVIGQRF